jgi:hypothetical protein
MVRTGSYISPLSPEGFIFMNNSDGQFEAAKCCTGGACVEVARSAGGVKVRDGKDRDGGVLSFEKEAWARFLESVRLELAWRRTGK